MAFMNTPHPFPTSAGPSGGARSRDFDPAALSAAEKAREGDEQAPLGAHPSYDDVLDVAVQYTFPCSDPISVDCCCTTAESRSTFAADARGPGEGAEPQTTDTTSRPR
jgi:hypothetical protein